MDYTNVGIIPFRYESRQILIKFIFPTFEGTTFKYLLFSLNIRTYYLAIFWLINNIWNLILLNIWFR